VAGQRRPSQLYSKQTIEVEIPLSEVLDRLEPPKGIDEAAWERFKGHTEYMANKIEEEKLVGLSLPQVSHQAPWIC